MQLIRQRATVVWIVLMAATCTSTWILSKIPLSPKVVVAGIFLIAALKAWLVVMDFMELRHAPKAARAAAEVWIGAVTLIILYIWFTTPAVA
jgi:hypothetical protein